MFVPSPDVKQELNQTLIDLHRLVRDELFPEIDVPGSIRYDGGLDAHKVGATISGRYKRRVTAACVTLIRSGLHLDSYAIRIGPGAALAGARNMAYGIAHELGHVVRYLELFENHPSIPKKAFLAVLWWLRIYSAKEERKVDELCTSRGIESFLNERWPA